MVIRKTKIILLLLSFLVLGFTGLNLGQMEIYEKSGVNTIEGSEWILGEIIVKFKRGVSQDIIHRINQRHGTSIISTSKRGRFKRLRIPKNRTVEEMVAVYSRNPNVEYAEPNFIAFALWAPDDPLYSLQWHMYNIFYGGINIEAAWDIKTGNPDIVVAVIDTGVAYENYKKFLQAPDLANTNFVQGHDCVNDDMHPNDDHGHGTHVTGTIAQSTNNGLGVAGIAFNTSIMPIKVLNAKGSGSYANVADGVYFAADNGASVINMSIGGCCPSTTLKNAVAYAYYKGVTIVCAGGNNYERGNAPIYPAAFDEYCIAVGATGYDESRAYYSNTGSYIDITAPGGNMKYDLNEDGYLDGVLQQTFDKNLRSFGYLFKQGTSMASPHVAGVAALLIDNGITGPYHVREALESTAEDHGDPKWDEKFGHGIVDAYAALGYTPAYDHDVAVINIDAPSADYKGDLVSVTVTVQNQGTFKETFEVSLTDTTDREVIGSEPVTLDAGNSTVVSFNWDTSFASTGEHTLEAVASTVLEEIDTADNSMETSINIKVKQDIIPMHVSDITLRLLERGKNYKAIAYVTIVDEMGNFVEEAIVTGNWTLNEQPLNTVSGDTNSMGRARLDSKMAKATTGNVFTITITDVVKEGYTYDPTSDIESSDSIIVE